MIKFLCYIVLFTSVAASCQETELASSGDKNCKSDDAIEQLTWLKEKTRELEVENSKYSCDTNGAGCIYIARGQVNGETIFEIGNCCPNINSVPSYYNCDGTSFCDFNNDSCPIQSDIEDREILWSISSK